LAEPLLQHVVLTGLPRAGSSVFGALIDTLPNHLHLNSPEWHTSTAAKLGSARSFCKWLVGEYFWLHKLAFEGAQLYDYRNHDGSPLFDSHTLIPSSLPPTSPLSRLSLGYDFTLSVRHTTTYTAILPELIYFEHFRVIAVVRNPIDVLSSWLAHPRLAPSLEQNPELSKLWPEAYAICLSNLNDIDRFAQLIECFFKRYIEQQDFIEIVRYEDILNNPERVSAMFGSSSLPANLSHLKKTNERRQSHKQDTIREALHRYGTCLKVFYPDAL
jgi:hypothetical protein